MAFHKYVYYYNIIIKHMGLTDSYVFLPVTFASHCAFS